MVDAGNRLQQRNRRLTAAVLALLIIGNLLGIAIPAGLGWDFANFYDTGRRILAGEIDNLYAPDAPIDGASPQGSLGFYGTPLSALLYAPLGLLPPPAALVAFKLQNALAYGLALLLLFGFYRRLADPQVVASGAFALRYCTLCLLYQPFWTVYRVGGQTTATVFLLLTLALVAHCRGRTWVSAWAFGAAAMIKPSYILGLGFLVLVSGPSFALATASFFVVAALASIALTGWQIQFVFIEWMRAHAGLIARWFYNSGLYVGFEEIRLWSAGATSAAAAPAAGPVFRAAIAALRLLVVAGSATFLVVAMRRENADGAPGPGARAAANHLRFVLALCFFLLLALTVWEHYLTSLFFLVAYMLARHESLPARLRKINLAIIVLTLGQNLILVELLRSYAAPVSLPAIVIVSLLKSGPLLLTALLLFAYRDETLDCFYDAPWHRAAPESRADSSR